MEKGFIVNVLGWQYCKEERRDFYGKIKQQLFRTDRAMCGVASIDKTNSKNDEYAGCTKSVNRLAKVNAAQYYRLVFQRDRDNGLRRALDNEASEKDKK